MFESSATGAEKEVLVKSLYMSLGPSMRSMKVLTPNSLFADSGNLLNHIMWAYGSSIVFMVKIDKTKVAENQIAKFRDHIVCKAGFRVSTRFKFWVGVGGHGKNLTAMKELDGGGGESVGVGF